MKHAVSQLPWFEITLIIGLAVALIVKPHDRTISATAAPEPTRIEKSIVGDFFPLSSATQPQAGL